MLHQDKQPRTVNPDSGGVLAESPPRHPHVDLGTRAHAAASYVCRLGTAPGRQTSSLTVPAPRDDLGPSAAATHCSDRQQRLHVTLARDATVRSAR